MPEDELWSQVAREMVAALRGQRSRAQFSRRLGYQTNAVSDWESGRRTLTAEDFLRICQRERVDLDAAFVRFHPATAQLWCDADQLTLAPWLDALRGTTPVRVVAERAGLSRFSAARFLRGQTRPRLHEFLRLLQALTFRAADWVGALMDIRTLPSLLDEHERRNSARKLAFTHPNSQAVLRIMETERYRALEGHPPGLLAAALGIEGTQEREILEALEKAGVIRLQGKRYLPEEPLTIDTSAAPDEVHRVKAHFMEMALRHLRRGPNDQDWFGYNLMSLSQRDLAQARTILERAYREIRALAAASKPVQVAALLNVQLLELSSEKDRPSDDLQAALPS